LSLVIAVRSVVVLVLELVGCEEGEKGRRREKRSTLRFIAGDAGEDGILVDDMIGRGTMGVQTNEHGYLSQTRFPLFLFLFSSFPSISSPPARLNVAHLPLDVDDNPLPSSRTS
jgi:hypothetical protein